MTDTLIQVDNVSKKFCRNLRKSLWYGVKDLGKEILGRPHGGDKLRPKEFWAIKDVSLELKRGECLGLIGRNGAGKTTLLRMLNGLISPDLGRIEMRGAVAAMIALGAGIKEILSGRENAYCMAALRGMTKKEAEQKIDEIIDFAEIHDAIDAPIQSYSSGMRVRLNFAVASVLNPDVLLLDEVLAVGDVAFRDKCYHRIANLRRHAAVIFVSHNMEQIARTSTHALVLHDGKPVFVGTVDEGIRSYEELNQATAERQVASDSFLSLRPPIVDFAAVLKKTDVHSGADLGMELTVTSERAMSDFSIKVLFYSSRGAFSADGLITSKEGEISMLAGVNRIHVNISSLPLKNGTYAVAFNIMDITGDLIVWSYKKHTIRISGAYVGGIADCNLRLTVVRPSSES